MSFDPFLAFVANWILPKKESNSRMIAQTAPKYTLPVLGRAGTDGGLSMQTIEQINRQCSQLRYNADPLGGLVDFYNHPEFTQWQLQNNRWDQPCDCDDLAVYAFGLLQKTLANAERFWIWNILVDPGSQFGQMWANHVMCAVDFWDGSGHWTAIIDTNSAANGKPAWFKGDKSEVQARVIQHFKDIYKVNYYALLEVPYPFR